GLGVLAQLAELRRLPQCPARGVRHRRRALAVRSASRAVVARAVGAREWQCLCDITLPLAAPQIGLALLLRSIDTFKLFDKVYALTGGGPGNATQTLSTYIYDTGFRFFNVCPASAASVLMLAASALLVSGYVWQTVRKRRA
ncbi:carbohydrate ABC transporter permease, partial [Pseudomonas aeruginosa]|uniref:carbohydrate ABC transporter permease n=1 Tax=Pseudomonas aeruginosa TaxID=287 RepID=UPI0024B79C2A